MAAIWEMLITGGPVIMLLAVMSVFSLSLIGVKLAQLCVHSFLWY